MLRLIDEIELTRMCIPPALGRILTIPNKLTLMELTRPSPHYSVGFCSGSGLRIFQKCSWFWKWTLRMVQGQCETGYGAYNKSRIESYYEQSLGSRWRTVIAPMFIYKSIIIDINLSWERKTHLSGWRTAFLISCQIWPAPRLWK